MTVPVTPSRGRPRSAEADQAIIQATLKLLGEQGYARMSIEAVAAEAGVGKTTIYRRYESKADLASAAVARLVDAENLPDSGSTRDDLLELINRMQRKFREGNGMNMIGTLLVEEQHNPKLLQLFRERVIGPRRSLLRIVMERGARRGEVRPDADFDSAIDALTGAYFARYLAGLVPDEDWSERIVDTVWLGTRK